MSWAQLLSVAAWVRAWADHVVTLADGTKKDLKIMTIGASNVYGFIGFDGPYINDFNDNGYVDRQTSIPIWMDRSARRTPLTMGSAVARKLSVSPSTISTSGFSSASKSIPAAVDEVMRMQRAADDELRRARTESATLVADARQEADELRAQARAYRRGRPCRDRPPRAPARRHHRRARTALRRHPGTRRATPPTPPPHRNQSRDRPEHPSRP